MDQASSDEWNFDSKSSDDSSFSGLSETSDDSISPLRYYECGRRRKQLHPRKCPPEDSNYRGAVVTLFPNCIGDETELTVLISYRPSKKALLSRKRKHRVSYCISDFEDEEEDDMTGPQNGTLVSSEKHCASCSVKKTPLWRDAEDGTPLCNACGIRYKKYKRRCGHCWHIPKKDEVSPQCKVCGYDFQCVYFGSCCQPAM